VTGLTVNKGFLLMNESNQGEVAPQPQVQAQQPAPIAPHGTSENMVPQHRVNELISDALRRGHEKAMRESTAQAQPQQAQMGHDDVRRMAQEEFGKAQQALLEKMEQQRRETEASAVLQNVKSKIDEASKSGKYPDYDEKVASLGLDKMPALLWHVNTVDNPGDVLYDLAENKGKIAMLNGLPPHLIPGEIKKLSDSIKANQSADTAKLSPEPFSSLKPSAGVGIDKRPSDKTASDWSKHYKGRF